jgi:hypothetical protein
MGTLTKKAAPPKRTYAPRTTTPTPKKLSPAFWIAWDDCVVSIESAFRKWPSKLASYQIVKLELEGLR